MENNNLSSTNVKNTQIQSIADCIIFLENLLERDVLEYCPIYTQWNNIDREIEYTYEGLQLLEAIKALHEADITF